MRSQLAHGAQMAKCAVPCVEINGAKLTLALGLDLDIVLTDRQVVRGRKHCIQLADCAADFETTLSCCAVLPVEGNTGRRSCDISSPSPSTTVDSLLSDRVYNRYSLKSDMFSGFPYWFVGHYLISPRTDTPR